MTERAAVAETPRRASKLWAALLFCCFVPETVCFTTPVALRAQHARRQQQQQPPSTCCVFLSNDDDDNHDSSQLDEDAKNHPEPIRTPPLDRGPLSRFTSPQIDDPGLPFADTLVAQIVGPSLQVFWLSLAQAPTPTWLRPIFDSALWQARGSLVAPTLIHGAGLACCWIAGALASQAYRRDAIDPTDRGWATVVWRVGQAGAFAVGLLILATQMDLLLEFGRYVQLGESEETDRRILSAAVEVVNDVVFEAGAITSMRFYLAYMTARRSQS